MRRTNTCTYRSISTSAPRGKTTLEPTSVSSMAALPNDWWRYYGNKLAKLTRNSLDLIWRCCGRAWLLPDMELLRIVKSWFNDVIYFSFYTVRVLVFTCQKNLTENRFHIPLRAVNRLLVHKTSVFVHVYPVTSKKIL